MPIPYTKEYVHQSFVETMVNAPNHMNVEFYTIRVCVSTASLDAPAQYLRLILVKVWTADMEPVYQTMINMDTSVIVNHTTLVLTVGKKKKSMRFESL
jgi:hypothetical protein